MTADKLTIVLTWTEEGVEPYGPEPRTDLGERRKVRIVRKPFAALWSYSGGEAELARCRAYATKHGGDARAFYIPTGAEDWKAQALADALASPGPAKKPRALQMTVKRLAILTQYRENLEGGDPHMGHVSSDDVRKLMAAGLIEPCERPKYHRAHVPTAAGLALLDAATATCAPPEVPCGMCGAIGMHVAQDGLERCNGCECH